VRACVRARWACVRAVLLVTRACAYISETSVYVRNAFPIRPNRIRYHAGSACQQHYAATHNDQSSTVGQSLVSSRGCLCSQSFVMSVNCLPRCRSL